MAVLVTRPDTRGRQLVEMPNKAGVVAIHLPLFSIEAGSELNQLPNKLVQLKAQDYVFAVSKNAVEYAAQTLKQTGFHWRDDLYYFTVGQQTAEYFTANTEKMVYYPFQQETSEGLLELPAMQTLHGKRILILRGNGGREFFAEQAQQRGAEVDYLECYRRVPIVYPNNEEQAGLCQRAGVQTVIATSIEILLSLMDFVPEKEHNWLKSCQLITVSRRIATFAKDLGWQHVTISPKADNQALLHTLLQNA